MLSFLGVISGSNLSYRTREKNSQQFEDVFMVFQTLRQVHIVHKVANILEVHIFSPVLIQRHFSSLVKTFPQERFEPP